MTVIAVFASIGALACVCASSVLRLGASAASTADVATTGIGFPEIGPVPGGEQQRPQAAASRASSTSGPRQQSCFVDTETLQTASDAYVNDRGVYPNGTGASNTGGTATTQKGQLLDIAALVPDYLHSLPFDRASHETFVYGVSSIVVGLWNHSKSQCE